MARCMVCALVALAPAVGRADGLAVVGGSPRAIGRAGAAVVGDDGAGALLINPAAMARRDTLRAEIGAAVLDDTVEWKSDAIGAPRSSGRAGSKIAPVGAAIGAIGDWVLGVGAMTAAVVERALPRPGDVPGTAPDKLGATYDYRYAGIAGSYRRDTLAIGVARRLGDSLALGAALGAARVAVSEHRRIWASAAARDPEAVPEADLDLRMSATDPFSLSAVAGLLYAPAEVPIEVAASLGWTDAVRLDGTVTAVGSPEPQIAAFADAARATMHVSQPLALRAGGRYVGDRLVAELDGDLWIARAGSESTAWSMRGLSVADGAQPVVDVGRVPSRISQQTHFAVRAAVDVALVPGFLWATAGYAYSTRATPASQLSPSFGDLGGHTLGLGLETTAGAVTVSLGWSRTWSQMTSAASALRLDSVYPGSDGPVPPGIYDGGSIDQVGVLVAAELGR